MLVWQCPSPRSHTRAAGVHRDDAFNDGVWRVNYCKLCECVILKKNNNLASPHVPPVPVSDERAVCLFDLYDPLRWMRWMRFPAGIMAADWFIDGVNEAGGW